MVYSELINERIKPIMLWGDDLGCCQYITLLKI